MLYYIYDTRKKNSTSIQDVDIMDAFNDKLRTELGIYGNVVNGISNENLPALAFVINKESAYKLLESLLLEYSEYPIEKLGNKSLQDFGISIKVKFLEDEKFEQGMKNSSILHENVLKKDIKGEEKLDCFAYFLKKIEAKGKELIIMDPYLFSVSKKSNEYCDMLAKIIEEAKASDIIVITDCRNYEDNIYKKIKEKLKREIKIKYSYDFHDRFWIADRKKGFYTGTSINGIGKRISLINLLSEEDVEIIIDELNKTKCLD